MYRNADFINTPAGTGTRVVVVVLAMVLHMDGLGYTGLRVLYYTVLTEPAAPGFGCALQMNCFSLTVIKYSCNHTPLSKYMTREWVHLHGVAIYTPLNFQRVNPKTISRPCSNKCIEFELIFSSQFRCFIKP